MSAVYVTGPRNKYEHTDQPHKVLDVVSTPPSVRELPQALARCKQPGLETAAHLLLPAGEVVGGTAHLGDGAFTWRGFTAPLEGDVNVDAARIRGVVLAGTASGDVFYDLSDDEYSWLTLLPSGAGSVLVGAPEVLGVPGVYLDAAASARAEESPAFLSRVILALVLGKLPTLVAHVPDAIWVTTSPYGIRVSRAPATAADGADCTSESGSRQHAHAVFSEVGKLQQHWGGGTVRSTSLPDPAPGVSATHVQGEVGCATVFVSGGHRQVTLGCHTGYPAW